jgi:hypothetical protein
MYGEVTIIGEGPPTLGILERINLLFTVLGPAQEYFSQMETS